MVLVFVAGLVITPMMVGLYILWAERHTRRFRKAKATLNKRGYEAIRKDDARIAPWGTKAKADARIPAGDRWPFDN